MKYIVRSPVKNGGKIRPINAILDLEDVDPGLIPSVLEPYQEPAPEPAIEAAPVIIAPVVIPEPPVPAELMQLEPLPEPPPAPKPIPPAPRPVPKAPVIPKPKTKKR